MSVPPPGMNSNNNTSAYQPQTEVDPRMAAMPGHINFTNIEGQMKSNSEKISYSLGFQAGENIKNMLQDADGVLLLKGFKAAIESQPPALDMGEMQAALKFLDAHMQQQNMKILEEMTAKNKELEVAFFEKNKSASGVKSLVDGIQYEIIKSGSGESPSNETSVIIHVSVALLNEKVIENSYVKKQPKQYRMNEIRVPGLYKALLQMRVGDQWKLFLPSKEAFGPNGLPQRGIEPCSPIVYVVELLNIVK